MQFHIPWRRANKENGVATPTTDLDPVDVADVLADHRRALIIDYLSAAPDGEKVTLQSVAKYVALIEDDVEYPHELAAEDWRRVYISLYQTHMIRLSDSGVVQFDEDTGELTPGPSFDATVWALEQLESVSAAT